MTEEANPKPKRSRSPPPSEGEALPRLQTEQVRALHRALGWIRKARKHMMVGGEEAELAYEAVDSAKIVLEQAIGWKEKKR